MSSASPSPARARPGPPTEGQPSTRPARTQRRSARASGTWFGGVLEHRGELPSADTWFLLGYAALFLLRPWEIRPDLAVLPFERVFALVLLAKIFVFSSPRLRLRAPGVGIALFLASVVASGVSGLDWSQSWPLIETVLKVGVFAICIVVGLRRLADIRAFLLGWVGIQFIYQSKAIWEYYVYGRGSYQMGIWRMRGIESTFGHPNTFCATTVLILPLAIALLRVEENRWVRAFLLAEIAAAVFVIFKTGSRAGLVELVLIAIVVLLTSRHRLKGVVALAIAVPVAALLLPEDLTQRYRTIFDQDANRSATESAMGRVEGLKKGVALFVERPVAGVGPNCFVVADRRYPGLTRFPGLQPHNLVGQLLGELGLLGLVGFGALVFSTLAALISVYRRTAPEGDARGDPVLRSVAYGGLLVLAFLFVTGAFGHNLYRYNWLWLAALVAAALNAADLAFPPRLHRLRVRTVEIDRATALRSGR